MARIMPPATTSDLRPHKNEKGSYFRRIQDIERALEKMKAEEFPSVAKFIAYGFACEKLATGITGVSLQISSGCAYSYLKKLELSEVVSAAGTFGLTIDVNDLKYLFSNHREQQVLAQIDPAHPVSARVLRNDMVHDFGPTNVQRVEGHADFLMPKMRRFLDCTDDVIAYLKATYAHLL